MHWHRYRTRTIRYYAYLFIFTGNFFFFFCRHFPFLRVYFLYRVVVSRYMRWTTSTISIDAIISSIYEPSATGYLILRNNKAKLEESLFFLFTRGNRRIGNVENTLPKHYSRNIESDRNVISIFANRNTRTSSFKIIGAISCVYQRQIIPENTILIRWIYHERMIQ